MARFSQAGPFILAFDTSMSGCSAAVLDIGTGAFETRSEVMERGQSEQLVPFIDDVMSRAGIGYDRLAAIVTMRGPGAFTGVRIGLSTARTMGLALDRPVLGLVTTDVIAAMVGPVPSRLCVILETKRDDFYACLYGSGGNRLTDPFAEDGASLAARLNPGDTLAGDAVERFMAENGAGGFIPAVGIAIPDPVVMARLGAAMMNNSAVPETEPLYLRPADVSTAKSSPRPIDDISTF